MLRPSDIQIDPNDALAALAGSEDISTRQDMFLLCLLHVEYLWNNHLLAMGFNSLGAIGKPIKLLEEKKQITIHPMKKDTKNVVYTLTRDGYSRLQLLLSPDVFSELGKGFVDRNGLPKQISHILHCNDFFFAAITAPSRPRVQWYRAKDAIDPREDDRSEIRNDARALINGREYWLEQDMGTENTTSLKTKFTRLASQLIRRDPQPALIFTVSLTGRISNIEKGRLYSPIQSVRQERDLLLDTKKNMRQHFYDTLGDYLTNLQANHTRSAGHHEKHGYAKRIQVIENLVRTGSVTYDDLCDRLKEKEQELKDRRYEHLEKRIAQMLGSRIQAIKISCTEPSEDGMSRIQTAMLSGADIYILRNEDLVDLLHHDLYSGESHITRVESQLHTIIENEDEESHLLTRSLYDRYTYRTSSEKEFTLRHNIVYTHPADGEVFRCAVEDMTYNFGAEQRIRTAFENVNGQLPLTLVCIVDRYETAKGLSDQYRLERFNTDPDSKFKCLFIDKETLRTGDSIYTIVGGQRSGKGGTA